MTESKMPPSTSVLLVLACVLPVIWGHSQLSDPQSTAPMTCRMGGEKRSEIDHCAGPCDLRAIKKGYALHGSPKNPAATYRRGQRVTVKYQRNNHGPGGFNRFTLVRPQDMMKKEVHTRNAFSFSCWGAHPVKARGKLLKIGKHGFSHVGNDGEEHRLGKGFYTTTITIPPVVPDGDYVLGWVWFGGTGSPVMSNRPQRPWPYGYFSDYWSCSFVRIRGGVPLQKTYRPVFNNDMKQFSRKGCMAANDSPGICTYEPCYRTGRYQKPKEFKSGSPRLLTPAHFGGKSRGGSPYKKGYAKGPGKKKTRGRRNKPYNKLAAMSKACMCIASDKRCSRYLATKARGNCVSRIHAIRQSRSCKNACCQFCKLKGKRYKPLCQTGNVRMVCST